MDERHVVEADRRAFLSECLEYAQQCAVPRPDDSIRAGAEQALGYWSRLLPFATAEGRPEIEAEIAKYQSVLSRIDSDVHSWRVGKLKSHIAAAKNGGKGSRSIAAFCKRLRIDAGEYYRWQRREPMRAPGYAKRIEDAIEKLPQ